MSRLGSSPLHLSHIIKVYPDECHCVGWAPSKGRRCQNPTNAANRKRATALLEQGTMYLQMGLSTDGILHELAPKVLCLRNHQSQSSGLVEHWVNEVDKYRQRQTLSALLTPPRSARASASPPRIQERFSDTTRVSQVSHESYSEQDHVAWSPRRLQRNDSITAQLQRLEAMIEALWPDGGDTRPSSITSTTPARTSTTVTARDSPESASVRVRQSTSHSSSLRQVRATTTPETTSTSPTTSPLTRATTRTGTTGTRRNVTRRSIEGDCAICMMSLLREPDDDDSDNDDSDKDDSSESYSDDSDSDDGDSSDSHSSPQLAWCKARCGNNYHKVCIDHWVENFRNTSRPATCPHCRENWRS